MKRIPVLAAGILAAGCAGTAPTVVAQEPAEPVSVATANVAQDIARNLGIDASQIPLSIQVPVDVAAAVCGVAPSALTAQTENATGQCTAVQTSSALDEVVRNRVQNNAQK